MAVSRFLKNLSVVVGIKCHTGRARGGGGARTRGHAHRHARAGTCGHTHTRAHTHAHTQARTQARAHIRTRTHAHACTHDRTHVREEGPTQCAAGAIRRALAPRSPSGRGTGTTGMGWRPPAAALQAGRQAGTRVRSPTSGRASGRHAAPWSASALDGPSWDRSPGQLADVLASALDGLGWRWPAPF